MMFGLGGIVGSSSNDGVVDAGVVTRQRDEELDVMAQGMALGRRLDNDKVQGARSAFSTIRSLR
jgi:hypothetical protein